MDYFKKLKETYMKKLLIFIRQSIIRCLGYLGEMLGVGEKAKIIVLCYHSVGNSSWKYSVSPIVFKQQINELLRTRKPISIEDLNLYLLGKKKITAPSFLLTFDDGYTNILRIAKFLEGKKIKPCVFLLADPGHANRSELGTNLSIATKKDWKKIQQLGWSIGSHSATHPDFSKIGISEAMKEIEESKKVLENTLGQSVSSFALPRGNRNAIVDQIVKEAGYTMCMTMDDGIITEKTNPFSIPRIGIDQTHSLAELRYIDSTLVVKVRSLLKKMKVSKLYE
jgi:peptidoglycan/xylan/chitin deacetylase (PgdA/CDA1 family)